MVVVYYIKCTTYLVENNWQFKKKLSTMGYSFFWLS